MNGWLLFGAASVLLIAALRLAGIGRDALCYSIAALFVAAAGYAWQGQPALAGAPVRHVPGPSEPASLYQDEIRRLPMAHSTAFATLNTLSADRDGESTAYLEKLEAGIRSNPSDTGLRIAYAYSLFGIAKNNLTPAVVLAFAHAKAVADRCDPAPEYFLGLAELEAGEAQVAEVRWRNIRASLCANSAWERPLTARISMFEMMRSEQAMEHSMMR